MKLLVKPSAEPNLFRAVPGRENEEGNSMLADLLI